MIAAWVTEWAKFWRSTVVRATTILTVLAISLICSTLLLAVGTTNKQLAAKLGPIADPGGWVGYFGAAAQVTAAGSIFGFGLVLSWMFGREFADGTITGLFALPVSRPTIAAAKVAVYAVWAVFVSVVLVLALVVFGLLFGLGPVTPDALPAMGRQVILALTTAAIAAPVGWAATLGRSVLTGIATAIGILVVAQVAVIAGADGWFTLSAPGLWAVSNGTQVSPLQLVLVVPLMLVSFAVTLLSWKRLQLDR